MRSVVPIVMSVVGAVVVGAAATALAVSGAGAIIYEFDTSARSAGMGSATTAVFWAEDANIWANPALLGYHHGVRYQNFRSQLATGLAENIFLDSDRVTFGAYGVGFSLSCWPFVREAGDYLDMGESTATDESGNVVGTFHPWMRSDSWSVGVSLAQLFDALSGNGGAGDRGLARYADVAMGWSHKRYADELAPAEFMMDGIAASAEATLNDRGLLVRATPYNSIDDMGRVPSLDRVFDPLGGLRLDLSYGLSDLNYNNALIVREDTDEADPAPRMRRRGLAVRAALGLPPGVREALDDGGLGLLAESLTPLLSYGLSWDHVTPWILWNESRGEYEFAADPDEDRHDHLRGSELVMANILFLRRGHVENRAGCIDGATTGWGLGFRLADVAGFRYDHAEVPQAAELPRVEREGYTLFVDGCALWRRLQ